MIWTHMHQHASHAHVQRWGKEALARNLSSHDLRKLGLL